MRDLIFLKVYKSEWKVPSNLNICEYLDYVPEELRFFSWEEYPLSYVPLHFCAENLVILEMPDSNIQQFFEGNQHFPNLKRIQLSNSKHLIALPELSHAPKIEIVDLCGCVNLTLIHSSIGPGKEVHFALEESGPVQMTIGGSVEVAKKAELGVGLQSLGSLLPFAGQVEWLESPVEFGDDFNQYYTYNYDDYLVTKVRVEEEEDVELIMEYCYSNSATLMEVEEEEDDDDDDDDELIMEFCCSNSADIFTRVPNRVTRWSLLRQLRLKESDIIGNAGNTVAQVSILKSLIALSLMMIIAEGLNLA
ncbi:hypothetical protein K1719_001748 [Acacia pycnantha]|nr:hypothetical protein K1719_001748 [Acacia pycnantha]